MKSFVIYIFFLTFILGCFNHNSANNTLKRHKTKTKVCGTKDNIQYKDQLWEMKSMNKHYFKDLKSFINEKSIENDVALIFAGDAMLGRSFNEKFKFQSLEFVDDDIKKIINNSDGVICNLETTISSSKKINKTRVFNFQLDPKYKNALINNKIKYVSLANNHMLDFGVEGLNDTISNLDSISIKHAGAGKNFDEASKHTRLDLKGIKIGFFSIADHFKDSKSTKNMPGIWYIDIESLPKNEIQVLENKIKDLKSKVDFVVISLHWNSNYVNKIEHSFIEFAHRLIDAGADIIHGHSPHHVLPIEEYKGKLIFYSLGAYIDDYAINEWRNDLSFVAKLNFNKQKKIEYSIIPIKINNLQTTFSLSDYEHDFLIEKLFTKDINKFRFFKT